MLPEVLVALNKRKEAIRKSFQEGKDPVNGQYFTKANILEFKKALFKSFNLGEISKEDFDKGVKEAADLVEINLGDRTIYVAPDTIKKAAEDHLSQPFSDTLEKGAKVPEGTRRVWNNTTYVKHNDGWVYVKKNGEHHIELPGGKRVKANEEHANLYNKHSKGEEESTSKSKEREGDLTSKDGEELTFRVYKDGGVKIEGANVRETFENEAAANKWIKENGVSSMDASDKKEEPKTPKKGGDFKQFEDIVKNSSSLEEAYDKAKKITGVSAADSEKFREIYGKNNATPKKAFENFYNKIKGGDSSKDKNGLPSNFYQMSKEEQKKVTDEMSKKTQANIKISRDRMDKSDVSKRSAAADEKVRKEVRKQYKEGTDVTTPTSYVENVRKQVYNAINELSSPSLQNDHVSKVKKEELHKLLNNIDEELRSRKQTGRKGLSEDEYGKFYKKSKAKLDSYKQESKSEAVKTDKSATTGKVGKPQSLQSIKNDMRKLLNEKGVKGLDNYKLESFLNGKLMSKNSPDPRDTYVVSGDFKGNKFEYELKHTGRLDHGHTDMDDDPHEWFNETLKINGKAVKQHTFHMSSRYFSEANEASNAFASYFKSL